MGYVVDARAQRDGGSFVDWWVSTYWAISPAFLVSWVAWVVISITLHELSHGWAALRFGDTTPRDLGHMTWNPFVHIPPMAWLLFAVFGFTWGRMPVTPSNFRGRLDDAKMAAAGPAMNLALAMVCVPLAVLWVHLGGRMVTSGTITGHGFANVSNFFLLGVTLNLFGAIFNLVPIPPLDGSRIVANFSPGYSRLIESEKGLFVGIVAFAVLFSTSKHIWPHMFDIARTAIGFGLRVTAAPTIP